MAKLALIKVLQNARNRPVAPSTRNSLIGLILCEYGFPRLCAKMKVLLCPILPANVFTTGTDAPVDEKSSDYHADDTKCLDRTEHKLQFAVNLDRKEI